MSAHRLPLVIVNPASSAGRTAAYWSSIASRVQRALGGGVEVRMTRGPGDGTHLVREALAQGPRRVISVGGDGTHHEVINGFFADNSVEPIEPDARFSFISSGTGSDLARSFPAQANPDQLLTKIAADDPRPMDLIACTYTLADQRRAVEICVNMASVGLGGWVTRTVDSRSKGTMPAKLLFFLTSVEGLFRTAPFPARFRLDGGQWRSLAVRNLVVANARFQGGGMEIAPSSDPYDGSADVVVSGPFRALNLVWTSRLIYQGRGHEHPLINMYKATSVDVEAADGAQPLFLELDGEGVGQTPVTFEVLPGAVQAIV